jgi:hypothetical protein
VRTLTRSRSLPVAQVRRLLAERLRTRFEEIESATLARVYAIAEPPESSDPIYLQGLHASLTTAIEYALTAIELGEARAPEVPPALLAQARMAGRNGVQIDTVLRRYVSGYFTLLEFVLEEARDEDLFGDACLQLVLLGQAAVFDRLIAAVSEEYRRELVRKVCSVERRRATRVRRLLDGELIDTAELDYDFGGDHLAIAASGSGRLELIRELAIQLDKRLLLVQPDEETTWAWLGSPSAFAQEEIAQLLELAICRVPVGSAVGVGESGAGREGWRLTHHQAVAAQAVARETAEHHVVRYADVALRASLAADDVLATSLRRIYLDPLREERDGGEALRDTLNAYLAAGRNITSAAAALRLNRETVRNRLRTAEARIGRPLDKCGPELEIALQLEASR